MFRKLLGVVGLVVAVSSSMAGPAQAQVPPQAYGRVFNGLSPRRLDSGIPTDAQMWKCTTSVYQQWYLSSSGQIIGNSPTGCLDGGSGANGALVPMVPCTGSASQRWFWDWNYGRGSYRIYHVTSGRCLDADLATIGRNGTTVQLRDCTTAANQQWTFESLLYYPN